MQDLCISALFNLKFIPLTVSNSLGAAGPRAKHVWWRHAPRKLTRKAWLCVFTFQSRYKCPFLASSPAVLKCAQQQSFSSLLDRSNRRINLLTVKTPLGYIPQKLFHSTLKDVLQDSFTFFLLMFRYYFYSHVVKGRNLLVKHLLQTWSQRTLHRHFLHTLVVCSHRYVSGGSPTEVWPPPFTDWHTVSLHCCLLYMFRSGRWNIWSLHRYTNKQTDPTDQTLELFVVQDDH